MFKKEKIEKFAKIMFIIGFLSFQLLFLLIFVRTQKDMLSIENRIAQKIPNFKFKEFLNSEYQNGLEDSIGDQLLGSETIKKNIANINNIIFNKATYHLRSNSYYLITKNLFGYGNSDYLLYKPSNISVLDNSLVLELAEKYNESANDISKYLYFVTTDAATDFNNPELNKEFCRGIKNLYNTFSSECLVITDFEEYKSYFYKNDHHWKYKGSYQGYKDIIRLLLGENEEVLEPIDTVEFDKLVYGSKSYNYQFYNFKENFIVYRFNVPHHKEFCDGRELAYGNKHLYFRDDLSFLKNVTHIYGNYYGPDIAEAVFDFSNPDKQNLLIIAASDSNAVIELIASHFNKTYVVDLRHIEEFDINEYINTYNIDKFLYMPNLNMIVNNEFELR